MVEVDLFVHSLLKGQNLFIQNFAERNEKKKHCTKSACQWPYCQWDAVSLEEEQEQEQEEEEEGGRAKLSRKCPEQILFDRLFCADVNVLHVHVNVRSPCSSHLTVSQFQCLQ